MNQKMVVFSPHPDDETLGCGGTIVRKLDEGYDVYIVVMTDGRHSHDHGLGMNDPSPDAIRSIRKKELRNAMKVLGVKEKNTILLDFEDGSLEKYSRVAKEHVKSILSRIRPAEIYVPYRNDEQVDHECTFKVVVESLEEEGMPQILYEYPIWSRKNDVSEYTNENIIVEDITNQMKTKAKAINVYQSQISKIFSNQERPVLQESFVDLFLQKVEVFFKN